MTSGSIAEADLLLHKVSLDARNLPTERVQGPFHETARKPIRQ